MNNTENEVKKIKTQIVPAIHNTVSLQVYLKTEDGNAIANKEIHYNLELNDGMIDEASISSARNETPRELFDKFFDREKVKMKK